MNTFRRAGWAARRAALPLAAGLVAASCSTADLLEVDTPDQITIDVQTSPVGAQALRVAALGNFATFFAGDVGGSFPGIAIPSGMLADEMRSARGGFEHLDQRAINEAVQPVVTTWGFVGQSHTQVIRAIRAIRQFALETTEAERNTKAAQLAQLYALQGMTYVLLGENYCNGIPLSYAADVIPQETEILSNVQLFNKAIAYFDSVNTVAGNVAAAQNFRTLAQVGRARALVNLNQYQQAAQVASDVATSYAYTVGYSNSTIFNSIYNWMFATLNVSPADNEGGNGLNFVSASDPRVTVQRNAAGDPVLRNGQDGLQHWTQTVHTTGDSGVRLASGIEARLIEAEAALARNEPVVFMQHLNAARTTRNDLAPLADPGTDAARRDLLFRERAFWMWGTAHRVGDLRRLVRQYNLPQSQVWPVGPYFKGGTFGTDMNLVPAQSERNNPDYQGCTDRNA